MPQRHIEKYFWVWPLILLLAVGMGVFTDLSGNPVLTMPNMDKIAHASYLALFTTLLARRWPVWATILAGIIVSVGIELGQMLTPSRSADINDALWGIVGSWIGWGLYQIKVYKKFLEYKLW